MAQRRRKFQRPLGERRYRKLFIIGVEGKETELQYFGLFNSRESVVHIKCLKNDKKSAPLHVLKRMQAFLEDASFSESDEAWLVVDRDGWTESQLATLFSWSQKGDHYGLALSNPKFEYWLLLHFEDGDNIGSSRECTDRFERYLPGYNKHIDERKFTWERIYEAIRRAKNRDNPPCTDWPHTIGNTTVYRLVERILHS
jgi:hypothetical protein